MIGNTTAPRNNSLEIMTQQERFTFFWGGPFSQWYGRHPFTVKGIIYNDAETYMMWYKDQVFGSGKLAEEILNASHPRDVKALGRKVPNFNEEIWNAVAKHGVFVGNLAKFTQYPHLTEYILNTRETTLVEASPEDKIWGIGLRAEDPRAQQRETWKGTKWLGEVLTDVREAIWTSQDIGFRMMGEY